MEITVGMKGIVESCVEREDTAKEVGQVTDRVIAQLAELQAAKQDEVDWLKNDIKLWRRFAFLLLGVGIILLAGLVFYIAWDVSHPASGLIRY